MGSEPSSVVELAAAVAAAAELLCQDWASPPSMTGAVVASMTGMSVGAAVANDWLHMGTAALD